MKTIMNSNII